MQPVPLSVKESARIPASCVTIGNFDGFHIGHQRLIDETIKIAEAKKLASILITFHPHPREVITGPALHRPLLTRARKLCILKNSGIENVLEINFTPDLAALSPEDFVKSWLLPQGMKQLVIGHDFSLGHQREGSFSVLKNLGHNLGFEVTRIDSTNIDGLPVSSTRLRAALIEGDIPAAGRLLGRPPLLEGKITHGYGRGRILGFPTANLDTDKLLLPGDGVYAAFAYTAQGQFKAVTNIGKNPTFNGKSRTVESFLLDADHDFYDTYMTLVLIGRIRDEQHFPSPQALALQIENDIAKASAMLDASQSTIGSLHEKLGL